MALTQAQLDSIRDYLVDVNNPSNAQLDVDYAALGDVDQIVLRYLRRSLNGMIFGNRPPQFAIPGEYSENRSAQISAMQSMIASIEAHGIMPVVGGGPIQTSQLVRDDAERGREELDGDIIGELWPR